MTIADLAAKLPTFRGSYAESLRSALAAGYQPCWSGADLKGKAKSYGSYHRSRSKVIAALQAAGLANGVLVRRVALTRYGHGRIVVDVVEGPLSYHEYLGTSLGIL